MSTVEPDVSSRPSAIGIWLEASRPKTLWAAVAPVSIAAAMAKHAECFRWDAALLCLLGALSVQIGTNFVNDYCDFKKGADSDKRQGPKRACAAGWVTPKIMLIASAIAFGVTLAAGTALTAIAGWYLMVVTILGILSGIAYTAGPYPLGYNGLGDLFAFIFFGPVAVAATWYAQAGTLPTNVWIAGLAPGCLSVAMISVNNLRDADEDRGTGKHTLAVIFGKNFARFEYLAAMTLTAVVPIVLVMRTKAHAFALMAAAVWFPGVFATQILFKVEGPALNRILAATGMMMLLYTILFSVGWLVG